MIKRYLQHINEGKFNDSWIKTYTEEFYKAKVPMIFLKADPMLIFDSEIFKSEEDFMKCWNANAESPILNEYLKPNSDNLSINSRKLMDIYNNTIMVMYKKFISDKTQMLELELQQVIDTTDDYTISNNILLSRGIMQTEFRHVTEKDSIDKAAIIFRFTKKTQPLVRISAGQKVLKLPKDLFSEVEYCIDKLNDYGIPTGIDINYGDYIRLKIICLVDNES